MKKRSMQVVVLSNTKKMSLKIFCCALLVLFTAPAWGQEEEVPPDPCNSPTIGTSALPVGSASGCGVLITITGTSGHLVATVSGNGTANGNPYDGDEDQLIGVQNNSSVTIGAIRLSSPPVSESSQFPYTSNLFGFDGDGPCNYAQFFNSLYEENNSATDCFNDPNSTANPGVDPYDYQGPDNIYTGISPDETTGTVSFITPIPPGGSTWFGMEDTPAAVVSIGETQQLVTGAANVFPFGPFTCTSDGCGPGSGTWTEQANGDDFQFTPVGGVTGADYWTFLPIPVCAGPVGESPFGPFTGSPSFGFTTGDFGIESPSNCATYGPPAFVTNFPVAYPNASSLACIPYLDYSSPGDPVCVELERDCSSTVTNDCTSQSLQWTVRLDYDIDANSIAGPIGGPGILFAPGIPGPTTPTVASENPFNQVITDFSVNSITSYTGAAPGADPPPSKGGGTDGKSVFVSAFSPAQSETNPIPVGVTVGFPGFEAGLLGPTSDTSSPSCSNEAAQYILFPSGKQESVGPVAPVNCLLALTVKGVKIPLPWVLYWDYTTTSNTPITNLKFCQTVGAGGACASPALAAGTNWVHLSLVPVSGCGAFTGQNPLLGVLPAVGENFANLGGGLYAFAWEPVSNPTGCQVTPVLQFNNGTIVSPAVFVYSF